MSIGVAALSVAGARLISNASATLLPGVKTDTIETDVLVIGGGYAGTFAAMKARDHGADVVMVEKGRVGRSGKSPWAAAFTAFDPASGASKESVWSMAAKSADNLVRFDFVDMWIEGSKAALEDLKAWGATEVQNHGDVFREQLEKNGVRLVERTMITELLEKDGRVAGAVGFPMEEDKAIVIKAKAVVICTGSGGFKNPGYPIGPLTYDGQGMAYRVGAEFAGKEWVDSQHIDVVENQTNPWGQYGKEFEMKISPRYFSGGGTGGSSGGGDRPDGGSSGARSGGGRPEGGASGARSGGGRGEGGPSGAGGGVRASTLRTGDTITAAHEGRVPVVVKDMTGGGAGQLGPNPLSADTQLVFCGTNGMALHRCDGIVRKMGGCASTTVDGLFTAGDAAYAAAMMGHGIASSTSATEGAKAGVEAAEFIRNNKKLQLSNADISKTTEIVLGPRLRDKGYSPAWVTQVIQHIMNPYYVLYIKKEERLKAALTNIEFLGEHFADNLLAKDPHELRLAHETRNMILNAEMKLRASLFRTESRTGHYREDFPEKDNKNWLAWVIISRDGGNMKLEKRPIPDAWKPGA